MYRRLILFGLVLYFCWSLFSFACVNGETVEELQSENATLQKKVDKNKKLSEKEQAKLQEYQTKRDFIEQQIETATNESNAINEEISEKEEKIKEEKKEVRKNKKLLKSRVRALYTSGESSFLDIILGSSDLFDFFDRVKMLQIVSTHDNELVEKAQASIDELNRKKTELEQSEQALEKKTEQLVSATAEYNSLIEKSSKLVNKYSSKAQKATEGISANNAEIERLNAEIEAYYKKQAEEEQQEQAEEQQQEQAQETSSETTVENDTENSQDSTSSSTQTSSTSGKKKKKRRNTNTNSSTSSNSNSSTATVKNGSRYIWPCPSCTTITSGFNENRGSYSHGGLDIGATYGSNIVAAASGTVSSSWYASSGWGGGYGTYCMIDHGNGYSTLYAHMSSISVQPGQHVVQGQVIGKVGSTGDSTGPHLHFETRLNGVKYNPGTEFPEMGL